MSREERQTRSRLFQVLNKPETSELATGKSLVEARAITEKYKEFLRFLETLPFTIRTAYRRIKMYDKACEMWPVEVVDRAIARKIPMFGVTAQKPMGAYESVKTPTSLDITTGEKIEDFLIQAELQVRRNAKGTTKKRSARDLLKKCFRMVEQSGRHL